MNPDRSDGDTAFDAVLTEALQDQAVAAYRDPRSPAEDAWRGIEGRRRHTALPPPLRLLTAAAVLVVVAVIGAAVFRAQVATTALNSGGSPTTDGSPTGIGPAPTGPPPTAPSDVPGPSVPSSEVPGETPSTTVATGPGPSTTITAAPRAGGIRSIDLTGLTVPTSICASNDYTDVQPTRAPLGSDITVRTPSTPGSVPAYIRQSMTMRFGAAVFGDVTGDGVDDAVVVVKCLFGGQGAAQHWDRAVVVDGASATVEAGPTLAASGAPLKGDDVPSATTSGDETVGHDSLYESMVDLTIAHGEVVTTWVQTANVIIPRINQWSRRVVSRQHIWDGTFKATAAPQVEAWVKDPWGSVLPFGPVAW